MTEKTLANASNGKKRGLALKYCSRWESASSSSGAKLETASASVSAASVSLCLRERSVLTSLNSSHQAVRFVCLGPKPDAQDESLEWLLPTHKFPVIGISFVDSLDKPVLP